jgi:hypothetical protein
VPTVAFPPFTVFTDHVTLLVEFATEALNCTLLFSKTVAADGEMLTAGVAVAVWQPAATTLTPKTKPTHRIHRVIQSLRIHEHPVLALLLPSRFQNVRLTANRNVLAGSKKLIRCGLIKILFNCGTT